MRDLDKLSTPQLFVLHASISEELRSRGITRTSNNIVGDLAEHLFCCAFGWKQAPNSMRDADATDAAGLRYQIKARRITSDNASRQLGALRNVPSQAFDFLAAVLFRENYQVMRAALIPHARVAELARYRKHTNSWRFLLRDAVWNISDVRDVTAELPTISNTPPRTS